MRRFEDGVCRITVADPSGPLSMMVTSVTPVNASPLAVVCSVNHDHAAAHAVRERRQFALNLLCDGAFAQGCQPPFFPDTRAVEFAHGGWAMLGNGAPAFVDSLLTLECRLGRAIYSSNQSVIIGLVEWLHAGGASDHVRSDRRFSAGAMRP